MGRERRAQAQKKPLSEINMTPLIDLVFLLLITFIITFPMIEQGIHLQLPRGQASKIDQSKSQSISITADGQVYFNNTLVTPEVLEASLKDVAAQDPQPPVLVRCDEKVAYGELVKTLRVLNSCKITRMALVTEPTE